MNETKKRILSALVLFLIFFGSISLFGKTGLLVLLLVFGVLAVDELLINFLKKERTHFSYVSSQLSFVGIYTFLNFAEGSNNALFSVIINGCFILNIALLIYLFFDSMSEGVFKRLIESHSYLSGLFFALPFCTLSLLVNDSRWIEKISLLLVLNFSVDTGAWFFGKKFGRKKLWPAVSPKKTVNGTVGGVLTSVFLSSILLYTLFSQLSVLLIIACALVAMCSQLGDLVQSKLKRQFEIKDSSQLIPGHGGVYDRLDSLLFIVPFYVIILMGLLK